MFWHWICTFFIFFQLLCKCEVLGEFLRYIKIKRNCVHEWNGFHIQSQKHSLCFISVTFYFKIWHFFHNSLKVTVINQSINQSICFTIAIHTCCRAFTDGIYYSFLVFGYVATKSLSGEIDKKIWMKIVFKTMWFKSRER